MKSIRFILTAILFSLSLQSFASNDEPQLTVYVDSSSYNRLTTDDELCCFYDIQIDNSIGDEVIIYHKQTGIILGRIYGSPSASYLKWLKDNVLREDSVNDIVTKTIKNGSKTNQSGL